MSIYGVQFNFHFLDIEELNQAASANEYDIVKISFAHYKNVKENYAMLQSGGAMGYGVGPLLVTKQNNKVQIKETTKVAIPGFNTTANFLLKYCYPQLEETQKTGVLFSEIENEIISGQYDLGVLIHEGRFTYKDKGLDLVADLGTVWEQREQLPIPLGCIVAKRNLGYNLIDQMSELITQSIVNYDLRGKPIISNFIKQHAQEMDEQVMLQHINLYVNEFSKNMGNISERLKKYFDL